MRGSFHTPTLSLLALVLVLSACEKKKAEEPKLAQINEAIPNLILPQGATFVSRSGSADALSIVFRAPDEPDAIIAYYRRFLTPPLWRLVSDGKDNTGAHVLFAEQQGPPLWVRVWPDSTQSGSYVQLTGGVNRLTIDTTTAAGRALKARQDSLEAVRLAAPVKPRKTLDSARKALIR